MTVKTDLIGNALKWFEENSGVPSTPVSNWRKARNEWLNKEGVGGIIKLDKKSKTFPDWWGSNSEFWFKCPIKEKEFKQKWK